MTYTKQNLQSYILEAEKLLLERANYVSEGNKLALLDMVNQAKRAMLGNKMIPHTRSREFYKPREEEDILFATKRYTMVPTYIKSGVFDYYGLKPAIDWFKTRDIMYGITEHYTLEDKKCEVEKKCRQMLEESTCGNKIGQYSIELANILKIKIKNMNDKEGNELAKAIIECVNALRNFRFSRIYQSDLDKEASLFINEKERQTLIREIKEHKNVEKIYEVIKKKADEYTIEQRKEAYQYVHKEACYSEWNKNYQFWQGKKDKDDSELIIKKNKKKLLWSKVENVANFSTPDSAVKATIMFILPSKENEQDGLGHVWIDNLEIISSQGPCITIANPGFEDFETRENVYHELGEVPVAWKPIIRKGKPVLRLEDRELFCGSEKRSIYICNNTAEDEGAWEYTEYFEVKPGQQYTLTFDCKVDGKLKEGLEVKVLFFDRNNECKGEYSYTFNRKAYIPLEGLNLSMQCNSLVYCITKDINYAIKTKYEILCMLNDFCQGVEHWLVTNNRPEGNDSYGAVQGGRNLCSIAFSYDAIKSANVFSEEEKQQFYQYIDYMLRYMLDYRDRTELSYREAQVNCGNWQTDMCIGASMIMMVLSDFPNRKIWLNNAYMVLRGQIETNINADGSWPESIRYHHAALERFACYAKVLLVELNENWFTQTRLGEMFEYSLNMQTPPYIYQNGNIATPPFGDHILSAGEEFAIYGCYIHLFEKLNKKLADKMYCTWERAGKPIKKLWGESLVVESLIGVREDYKINSDFRFNLKSSGRFKDAGIYVFRKDFGSDKESFCAIMSSPRKIGHGHLDQGSFMIYKDNIPIVMDSGIEGYFDVSTPWHICSYSHACVQFATKQSKLKERGNGFINLNAGTYSAERGWVDVPTESKVIEYKLSDDLDQITIEIKNPEGKGVHTREFKYYKKSDVFIIRDTINGFDGKVLMSIPVVSKHSKVMKNRIISTGYYNIDLETTILSNYEEIILEKGRTSPLYPTNDKIQQLEYIRVIADAADGFTTVLYPHNRKDASFHIDKRSDSK